ncbi:U-box domain-containing protein 52-like isoform X1 [Malus sylvestris]|uniref:U-box domain-containing protein 52-like isoform X1 n=1 Tax=Malus sylvestris TaxID=3752 RepID=UPI0021ABB3C1|nr:U-box domain-containing protein 52-like isoform X1 [Malus sylvestris]
MALFRQSSAAGDPGSTVVAIDRDKNSQLAVKWAVDNLLSNRTSHCILIHVRNRSLHPQDVGLVSKDGRPPTEDELQQFFLPYRGFCARKGIVAKEVIIHDIDVPSALIDYIVNNSICNIVVGASSRNVITRKLKDSDVPTCLLKSVPETCAVYVISKGRIQTSGSASRPQTPRSNAVTPRSRAVTPRSSAVTPRKSSLQAQLFNHTHGVSDFEDVIRKHFSDGSSNSASSDRVSLDKSTEFKQLMPPTAYRPGSTTNSPTQSVASFTSETSSHRNSASGCSDLSGPFSFQSNGSDNEGSGNSSNSQTPSGLDAEMRRLRVELKQTMDMYTSACKEATTAKQNAWEMQKWRTSEERKLEEAKLAEEAALAMADMERQKSKAATEAARMAQRLADLETQKRKIAERKAKQEAEESRRAIDALVNNQVRYRRYTIEEIEIATDYFNNSNKIGEGGYGPVYRAILDHTPVAIKVLRPDISQGQRQFQQEVEVLSCIRHPHMVILVGACPEYGCLVYEYMENGSLEDRLFCKNNTPPISWAIRFKISAEIATALLFLHQTKPEPLVHRDLKPGNILVNQNYVSKIADVGLARLVPPSIADSVTQYRMTEAAGTFCYIDPEYQQTGMLGVKSDIYSLGVMLLQIITARPAMGLSHQVEKAIEKGTFAEMLDPAVTNWPVEEALSFAKLALKCCELRKKDRPDLSTVILPELNRLRDLGMKNEATEVSCGHYSYTGSLPPMASTSTQSQINVKKRWLLLRLESMTKVWSFKNSFRKGGCSSSSSMGRHVGKLSKKQVEGCWTFVSNCSSVTPTPLRRSNSFSQ